jgi:protein-tyrosine phosphatase
MSKVSQNISTDSLFHFVRQRPWLLRILKDKAFKARYVYEELPEIGYFAGIPMKCFCDIPLGVIKKHIGKYGRYGIGIKKEFARKHGFSPVFYVHENSDTMKRYLQGAKKSSLESKDSLLPYFKYDETYKKSKNGNKLTNRLYDEREWRWIPDKPVFENFKGFSEEEIISSRLEHVNDQLDKDKDKYTLQFDFSDITYIFVQFEDDVDKVIEEIRKSKIDQKFADRLISKIVTSRQIERDF